MNIFVLEDSAQGQLGGGQRVTLEAMDALRGSCNLFLIDTTNKSPFFREASTKSGKKLVLKSSYSVSDRNLNNFDVSATETLMFCIRLFCNLVRLIAFYRRNRSVDSGANLFYITTKKGLIYGLILKRLLGIRYVFHAHNVYSDLGWIGRKFLKTTLSNASRVIAVSSAVKDHIEPRNVKVIYNPITLAIKDTQRRRAPREGGICRVATVSALLPYKGVDIFLESYQHLKSKRVVYKVYGDGPQFVELKQRFSKVAEFKGFRQEMSDAYASEIDILVVPSISDDAFSLVILEAMMFGIPVIATDVGAHAELISDSISGFLIAPGTPHAIADKVDRLLADKGCYDAFSAEGRLIAERFGSLDFHKVFQAEIVELIAKREDGHAYG